MRPPPLPYVPQQQQFPELCLALPKITLLIQFSLYKSELLRPAEIPSTMNFAIRSTAARSYCNHNSRLFASPAVRRPCGALSLRRLTVVSSSSQREDNGGRGGDMDKNEDLQTQKVKDKDTMAHSFGVGYSTRSDEEGFGGIYGCNQPSDIKDGDEIHEDHPLYDKTQGSQVKEKEKARNQTSAA